MVVDLVVILEHVRAAGVGVGGPGRHSFRSSPSCNDPMRRRTRPTGPRVVEPGVLGDDNARASEAAMGFSKPCV